MIECPLQFRTISSFSNTIEQNTVGIYLFDSSGFGIIQDNSIIDNYFNESHPGTGIWLDDVHDFQIMLNVIMNNGLEYDGDPGRGILIYDSYDNTITMNNIWWNDEAGVSVDCSGPTGENVLVNNNLENNLVFAVDNQCEDDVIAPMNWWGSVLKIDILDYIWDFDDDPGAGIVHICPYLDGQWPAGAPVSCQAGGFGECFLYNDNETGCQAAPNCEYDSDTGDCYYAPECWRYDDNQTLCENEPDCKYDHDEQICVIDFAESDCYNYTNETTCLNTGYYEWDYFEGECYEDFGNECAFYDGDQELCEQQPACLWFPDEQICDPDYEGGHGSYCWDYDDNQTACEAVGGCFWFTDPFDPGDAWCDPLGVHEVCDNGIDDDENGMCDFDGCDINGTFYPPDPDCSFEEIFDPVGYFIEYPHFGPNIDVNHINITFSNTTKVSSAWYTLNSLDEPYCDWWIDPDCRDGDITLAAESITDLGSTLVGEYELAVFVEDNFGNIHPSYVYFFSGSTELLKPSIFLIYPENGSTVPHEMFLEFEIDPKGPPTEISFSIDGDPKGELPGFFFHPVPVNNALFPAEGEYELSIFAANELVSTTVNYTFYINDSDEIWQQEGYEYANEIEDLVEDKSAMFDDSSFFTDAEFEIISILGLDDIIVSKLMEIRDLIALLESETNQTVIQNILDQIRLLKSEIPGEVKVLEALNDILQNIEGAYVDSVIRNFQNLTNETIDLAATQNEMKKLEEIRKEAKKIEVKYLDGTPKNVTKVTEKFVSNVSSQSKEVTYIIHDEFVPDVNLSSQTKTILLPSGIALIEIDKNITGNNDLNLCIGGLPVCGSDNLSEVNTSVIDVTGDIEFIIIKADPIVKWNFQTASTTTPALNPSSRSRDDTIEPVIEEVEEPEEEEPEEQPETITIDLDSIKDGVTKSLKKGDSVVFNIGGQEHTCIVEKIEGNKVTLTIMSDPVTVILQVAETRKLDMDDNGYYDLSLTLKSISAGSADITFKEINEKIKITTAGSTGEAETQSEGTSEPEDDSITGRAVSPLLKPSGIIGAIVIVIILSMGVGVYYFFFMKK